MTILICLDDNNGMMFNNRRLSMDKVLREHILKLTTSSKLFMNNYSYKQFNEKNLNNITIDDNFLDTASKGDYCFVENNALSSYADKIEKIIIYKWNRIYPSDMKFDLNLKKLNFKCESICDFKGNSHNKITEEVYTNEKI